jgi:UDP-N-acetylglucosamine 1-carboxyvinyltransferase
LNKCGAKIKGAGDSVIVIEGVNQLHGCDYDIMPDRITAATYMAAGAITGGELILCNARYSDIDTVAEQFERAGCRIYPFNEKIYIKAPEILKGTGLIKTMTYPGFPTDAQPVVMAALCKAKGTTIFEENIFEDRYRHAAELARMGANIHVAGKAAFIEGVSELTGAKVEASDLRGGAALIVAALGANGESKIANVKYIDRGYEDIEEILTGVGAVIKRE